MSSLAKSLCRTLPLFLVLLCVVATTATANYADTQGRPRFNSYTANRDPVNILFTGGSIGFSGCSRSPVPSGAVYDQSCMERLLAVVVDHWDKRACNGGDELDFIGQAPRGQNLMVSSSRVCARQFHLRLWDDRGMDIPTGQFMVGGVHHEHPIVRPHCFNGVGCYFEADHKVDGWNTAEAVLTRNAFIQGQCSYFGFRTMPHQHPQIYRGEYNDGRLSRISQTSTGSCSDG